VDGKALLQDSLRASDACAPSLQIHMSFDLGTLHATIWQLVSLGVWQETAGVLPDKEELYHGGGYHGLLRIC
jgi:hypothetical protein